eukprot:11963496-Heterocapsa_arctica.AAC.1
MACQAAVGLRTQSNPVFSWCRGVDAHFSMLAIMSGRPGRSSGGPHPPPCRCEMMRAALIVARGQQGAPLTRPMRDMAGRSAQGAHRPVPMMAWLTLVRRFMSLGVGSAVFAG